MSAPTPEWIKATIDALQPIITKPPLTEKALSQPPIRYLHDIVMAVADATGFARDQWTDEEKGDCKAWNKDQKLNFFKKLVDLINEASGTKVDVNPRMILAGKEPEKTNALLQALARVSKSNGSSSNATPSKQRAKSGGPTHSSSTAPASQESKSMTASSSETHLTPKDTRARSKSADHTRGDDKKRDSSVERTRSGAKSAERDANSDDRRRGSRPSDSGSSLKERDRETKERDRETKDREQKDRDMRDRSADRKRGSSTKSSSTQDTERSKRPNSTERASESPSKKRTSAKHSAGSRSGGDGERGRSKVDDADTVGGDSSEPSSHEGEHSDINGAVDIPPNMPRSEVGSAAAKRDAVSTPSETGAAPALDAAAMRAKQMQRPSSARPAPPALAENVRIVDKRGRIPLPGQSRGGVDGANAAGGVATPTAVAVIVEGADDKDNDEDIVVVPPPAEDDLPPTPRGDTAVNGIAAGGLVSAMVKVKENLEQGGGVAAKTEENNRAGKARSLIDKEATRKEVETLRESLQTLTQAVNPLGKQLDYVQEDMEVMSKELEFWKNEESLQSQKLEEEQRKTEQGLQPLYDQLALLEQKVKEILLQMTIAKANILRNEQKIQKMLHGVMKPHSATKTGAARKA